MRKSLSGLVRALLLTTVIAGPGGRAGQVVFSEVMYHPPEGYPEYLEVRNLTATVFDIAGWRFRDGIDYAFPEFNEADPDRTFLRPYERIVIAEADEATTRAAYAIPTDVRVYGPWQGNLDNAGERLTLEDANGLARCTLAFEDAGDWPVAADGAGHSLVLVNADRAIDDWRNWRASTERLGTPGSEPVEREDEPIANPELQEEHGLTLVDYDAVWRYHDRAQDLGDAWREPDYNDADWPEGPGLLGVENAALPAPGLQTVLTMRQQLTYYFRTKFTYAGTLAKVTLALDQIVDDGVVYYLNGVELGRVRVGVGEVTFNTPSNGTVSDATEELEVLQVPATALRQGINVLAAEVHQTGTGSSDIVLGARLRARVPLAQGEGLVINELYTGGNPGPFVEIFNPTDRTVNLQGHYLSESSANLQAFEITADLPLPPGGLRALALAGTGFGLLNPVTLYLTAPDGTTVLNAVRLDLPADGRSAGRKPDGAADWFRLTAPTRAEPNAGSAGIRTALAINEVHFSSSNTVDWIELFNRSNEPLTTDGLLLAGDRDLRQPVPLHGSILPRGYAVIPTSFPLEQGRISVFLADARHNILDAHALSHPPGRDSLQALPDGTREWYSAVGHTPDAPNDPARETKVVINEILCDPPSNLVDGEFIELHNHGPRTVDVSGWRLEDGVRFRFPDGTSIPSGGFLVVAANRAYLGQVHPDIPIVGDYQGRLANEGERLRLVDAAGNLADEVDFHVRGDWPELVSGMGSSLELRHPSMDNAIGTSWASSDETAKGPWREFRYRGTYQQWRTLGSITDYREVYFHLVGDGHLALKDLELIRLSTGQNLLVNGDRISPNNRSADGWLCQGTHWQSHFEGGTFHLISTGRGDNRPNRVELDTLGMLRGDECELRFQARWIAGNPRLVFSTWDHSIATSFLLEIPADLGTPGRPNSALLPAGAPALADLAHHPAVPRATEPVRLTVRVVSPEPLQAVQAIHRADNANGDAAWTSTPMRDDGGAGDAVAGDGLYTVELSQYQRHGQVAQFYVLAETVAGRQTVLPRGGAARPALFVTDNTSRSSDLRLARFVVSQYDLGAIGNGESAPYDFKFPRLSNHYKNATFISNERDIYYNAEIRNSGSPWTRATSLDQGKWKLPEDRRFRERMKFFYDRDPTLGRLFNNRMTRYLLYRIGHPASENEFIRLIINSGAAQLREETEPVGNDMLDRIVPEGARGNLYKIDDEWWFRDDWEREYRDADWSYKGTDNAGRYRTEWMKRTNEDEDDYSDLIALFQTFSGTYSDADSERLMNVHETMKMFVVRGYIDDWDSISLNRGKNGYMYRPPNDSRFHFLHWDSDLTFGNSGASFYNGLAGVNTWIRRPANLRVFHLYLAELVEHHTRNSARTARWLEAEEAASSEYSSEAGRYLGWFNARHNPAIATLGANYRRPFVVTRVALPGNDGATELAIEGVAPTGIATLRVTDHPEAITEWTGMTTWRLSGLELPGGSHQLEVVALDRHGRPVSNSVTSVPPLQVSVDIPGNASPVARLSANPASWHVATGDRLELDARTSHDPEGTPIRFAWSTNPAPGSWTSASPGLAEAVFRQPGLYQVTVEVSDADGEVGQVTREAAVFGPQGFSSFNERTLDSWWRLDSVIARENHVAGPWLALDVIPGHLVLQVTDHAAFPPATAPALWRTLPAQSPWAFATKVDLTTRQFGTFLAGLAVAANEGSGDFRLLLGIQDGRNVAVKRVDPLGDETVLHSVPQESGRAELRVRREANTLHFERQQASVWEPLYTLPLAANAETSAAGLLVTTPAPQAVQAAFDFALLVNPDDNSPLRDNLIITELMYNPVDGEEYEFLELANIGPAPLDLTGCAFTEGITYTFNPTELGPSERLVLARDPVAFASRYGTHGIRLAPGGYSGRLDNAGERLTLVDAQGDVVFSFNYGDRDPWPTRADGLGSSLERIDLEGDPDDAENWQASRRIHGTPGTAPDAGPAPVVINEILAHSDPPFEDAIELHNLSDDPVNIGGWFLTDSLSELTRYRIPNGRVIPPRGYAVFYEVEFNTNNVRVPFSFSSVFGDEAVLTAVDAAGNPAWFADAVTFGPSANGIPFGRYPNGTGPLTALRRQTLGTALSPTDPPEFLTLFRSGQGAPNSEPLVGPVVISEIMYNPDGNGAEYLKLLNITSGPVALFDPLHATNQWQFVNGIEFRFPAGITLAGGEECYLCGIDPALFRAAQEIPAETRVFGPWQGNLDNAGEAVELARPDTPQTLPPDAGYVPYLVVERVRYDNQWPWPTEPDGTGPALRRINPAAYGDDAANWTLSTANPDLDTDQDGMPDDWERSHGLNPNLAADAAGDLDDDELTNLEEYQADTDPQNPASGLRLEPLAATGASLQLRFEARANRAYRLEHRAALDLSGWSVLEEVAAQSNPREVIVTDTVAPEESRFYRLVLTEYPGMP